MAAIIEAPRVYTLDEASQTLKVTKKVLVRLLNIGEMKGSKIGHQWRIPAQEIERYANGVIAQ